MSRSTQVVLGPRTRLGRALLAQQLAQRAGGTDLRLVARDDADVRALVDSGHARDEVVDATAPDPDLLGEGSGPVEVHVCALGPVHPDPVDPTSDWTSVARDLELLRTVVDAAGSRPVRIVLVSTAVALAPTDDRRYYAGWKNLVEAEVQLVVAQAPGATLDVLYPGRLVAVGEQPWHRLHATYPDLADRMLRAGAGGRVSRVVGRDARLWLLVRGVRTMLAGLFPTGSGIDARQVPLDSGRTPLAPAPKETVR